jgi:AAHS family benzoate transporter-like MFS transporter
VAANTNARARGFSYSSLVVLAICWAAVVFDGYDVVVYGAVLSSLLAYEPWGLTSSQAGIIGSAALVGILFGSLLVGTVTDIFGRRKTMLFCISWFSIAMGLCAGAPSPELFGLFRFLAGLGLGGVLPTAIALTVEYAPTHRRNLYNALMFSGFVTGGLLSALLAIPLIPAFGWRVMFWIGVLPLVLIVPLAYKFLPESISFLLANDRREEAEELARRFDVPAEVATDPEQDASEVSTRRNRLGALATLFSKKYVVATLLFWGATFMGLLLIYGVSIWLPDIMLRAGYALGSSIAFLLVLDIGGIAGVLVTSMLADRLGSKRVIVPSFLLGAVTIFLLSFQLPSLVLYALVAVAGVGVHGTQILINGYVATYYPAASRATALGWSLGIGRLGAILGPILGGLLAGSQLGLEWNFYVFAAVPLLGMLLISAVPRSPVSPGETPT